MKYKNTVDMHVHTDNSPDGHVPATLMCERACAAGLRAVAFTDHCETDAYIKDNYDRITKQAYFEVAKAKSAFVGELLVLQGIEVGQGHYDPELADAIIGSRRYDVVLGSMHNSRGGVDPYYIDDFSDWDIDAYLNEYFDSMLEMIQWGNFDVLAHMTYPMRYFFARNGIRVDLSEYSAKIDEILSLLVEKDKALEINTAALRKPLRELSPELPTVRRFYELGGRLISVGSDAHYLDDLGAGIDAALDCALAAGFGEIAVFTARKPNLITIERERE